VVECLSSKCEALSSSPRTVKKKKKKRKKEKKKIKRIHVRISTKAGCQLFMPVILATKEARIRGTEV
jgi:hypothetical protein